jgi:hypothetical protein
VSTIQHPTEAEIADYIRRSLEPELQHIDAHLWQCEDCWRLMLELLRAEALTI